MATNRAARSGSGFNGLVSQHLRWPCKDWNSVVTPTIFELSLHPVRRVKRALRDDVITFLVVILVQVFER